MIWNSCNDKETRKSGTFVVSVVDFLLSVVLSESFLLFFKMPKKNDKVCDKFKEIYLQCD